MSPVVACRRPFVAHLTSWTGEWKFSVNSCVRLSFLTDYPTLRKVKQNLFRRWPSTWRGWIQCARTAEKLRDNNLLHSKDLSLLFSVFKKFEISNLSLHYKSPESSLSYLQKFNAYKKMFKRCKSHSRLLGSVMYDQWGVRRPIDESKLW